MAKEDTDKSSRRAILTERFDDKLQKRNIDTGDSVKRNVNDVVDTLSPPPRRDKGTGNGEDNN